MSENSQKRFEEIMQKLSQSTPPLRSKQPSLSMSPSSAINGWKNNNPMISNGLIKNSKPWDRGDFLKRLSSFKAMTWFGKPKVINPVNCARRGWINVEVDVIVCEACRARLLFTTPSSWPLQQVEKAAAVFSLKLDNGHKMLCPWINNTCDEKLALFPPTAPLALVDSYIQRSSALLRLTALPAISSLAIDYMNSPQLDQFFSKSSPLPVNLSDGISLIENRTDKGLEGAEGDASATAYYQAQKSIALCGWEPCLLPYSVNSESEASESVNENQYDLSCVTLDCKLCGARVGLWAFKAVQRPLESFTVTAETNGHAEPAYDNSDKEKQNSSTSPGSKLTIAGGPLPTEQNFRPVVSFPIVSRHFRARWAYNSDVGCYGEKEGSDIASSSADICVETVKECVNSTIDNDDSARNGVETSTLSLVKAKETSNSGSGYMEVQASHSCKINEFNPIKQHRPFCPWIGPESGGSLPGWKVTLNALSRLDGASSDTRQVNSSKSNNEADDPLVSIRKLFMSPPAKRFKDAH